MQVFVDTIEQRTRENPVAPALISPLGSITYAELLDTIVKVSNLFADRRVPRLARVYMNVRDAELRFAITVAAISAGLVPAIAAPETLKRDFDYDFTIGAAALLRPDMTPDIVIDETVLAGKLADGKRRRFPDRGDDDLAMLSETTGTTGYPKLLATSAKALRHAFDPSRRRQFAPGDRLMFAMGGISRHAFQFVAAATAAGAAAVSAPVDPVAALKMITLYEVTELLTTPMGVTRLVDAMERLQLKAPSIKRIGLTGSMLNPDTLRRIEANFAAEVSVRYGTSEALRLSAGVVEAATFERGYVGRIREGVTIVSAGTRQSPAPIVIANDLKYQTQYVVGGKIVTDDRATVTLPDLGFVENGGLFVVGRADEVFNLSGNKLAFSAIQEQIEHEAGVRDVGIVSGGPIGRDDDLIIAISADVSLDLADLSTRVLETLGWAEVKDHFVFFQTPAIPRNSTGKVDRQELLRLYGNMAQTALH